MVPTERSSQGLIKLNINELALTVQKLLTRLKFQRGQNDRQDKNNLPPIFDFWGMKINIEFESIHQRSLVESLLFLLMLKI